MFVNDFYLLNYIHFILKLRAVCLSCTHIDRYFGGQYATSLRKDIPHYQANCNVYADMVYTGWSKILCAPDDYSTIISCTETLWSLCILNVKRTILSDISRVYPQLLQQNLLTRWRLLTYLYFAILCPVIALKLEATDGGISWKFIQGVTGGTDQTSGECFLGQTIPI